MEEPKFCLKCSHELYFDSYFSRYKCPYCLYMSDRVDKFKGNEQLLDSFVNLIFDCIQNPELYENQNSRQLVKLYLLKLLNSL